MANQDDIIDLTGDTPPKKKIYLSEHRIASKRTHVNGQINDKTCTSEEHLPKRKFTRYNLRSLIQLQNPERVDSELVNTTHDDSHPDNLTQETVRATDTIIITDDLQLELNNSQHSEFRNLQNLESMSFIKNSEPFQCLICFVEYGIQEGVTLRNCFHMFCRECVAATIQHSDEPTVVCPFNSDIGSCQFVIEEREIRGLVSAEIYELHLKKALKRAAANLENIYHCNTPDCAGFVESELAANAFPCPVCDKVNCVKCKAIHEDKTCEEYQFDLKNDVKNQKELKLTEKAVQTMLKKGNAMLCPKCNILIQKSEGCDYVQCISCKLGICYRTKKPRQPLTKIIDGVKIIIDGCHCNEGGKLCHPKCGNCH